MGPIIIITFSHPLLTLPFSTLYFSSTQKITLFPHINPSPLSFNSSLNPTIFFRSLLRFMETTLEIGGGGLHALKVEKDYMDMSKDGELELELSLGNGGCGVGVKGKGTTGSAWGDCGRILTAGDFQNGFSTNWVGISSGSKRERAISSDCVDETGSISAAVSQVVGWPPVRTYRMNTLVNQSKTSNLENDKIIGGNERKEISNKKTNHGTDKNEVAVKERGHIGYVKVNMDGLLIGRKVDVNAHKSYETLAKSLEDMFFNESPKMGGGKEEQKQTPKLLDGSSEFVLTYEDKEGDWMLVGDVPWGMFLNTVKRLRIMKTCEANGLAPKFHDVNEKLKSRAI